MEFSEKICAHCQEPFKPKGAKAMFCSDTCRVAHHRSKKKETKPIKQPGEEAPRGPLPQFVAPFVEVLEGITLEQFRHYMKTYPDQKAIKELCREILDTEGYPLPEKEIPQTGRGYDHSVRVPTLTPEILDEPQQQAVPKYLPPRPIVNPEGDVTKRMVDAPKGTPAYYIRNGKWGDHRDGIT